MSQHLFKVNVKKKYCPFSELQKRKQKAQEENNQKLVAELCNKLGNQFISALKYTEALDEFKEESRIYSMLDKQIDFGRANRMVK